MRVCSWILLLLCALSLSSAQATVANRVDPAYGTALPAGEPTSDAVPAGEGVVMTRSAMPDMRSDVSVTPYAVLRVAPAIASVNNDAKGMSAVDVGLMLLFAAGLIAYQLDRKQRELRRSLLSPS